MKEMNDDKKIDKVMRKELIKKKSEVENIM